MLRERLLSSTVLVAISVTLVAIDFWGAPRGGEGLALLPLLWFFAIGTAWDVTGLIERHGQSLSRPTVIVGTAIVTGAAVMPTLWNLIAARTGAIPDYPLSDRFGPLGWSCGGLVAMLFVLLIVEMRRYVLGGTSDAIGRVSVGAMTLAYVGMPMSFLVATRLLGEGNWGLAALISVIAVTKFADAGAYFVGRTLGRHKLVPRLSPGKTWEGAIGGVVVATVVAALSLAFLFPWMLPTEAAERLPPLSLALVLGPTLAIAGMIGDLSESMIKRDCGEKDSGDWLPGLGGMWDVTDSLIAATFPGFLCFAVAA